MLLPRVRRLGAMALGQKTPGEVSLQLDLNNVTIRQIATIPGPEMILKIPV